MFHNRPSPNTLRHPLLGHGRSKEALLDKMRRLSPTKVPLKHRLLPFQNRTSLPRHVREEAEDTSPPESMDGLYPEEDKTPDSWFRPPLLRSPPGSGMPDLAFPRGRSGPNFLSLAGPQDGNAFTERRQTIRDGRGNEETTVSRTMGDKTYSVTTWTDMDGRKQTKEDFVNMGRGSIEDFEERWSKEKPMKDASLSERKTSRSTAESKPTWSSMFIPPMLSKMLGFKSHDH